MKTSTKLLIIFFVSIPVSLWAYNVLLKKQLDAGNLTLELRPNPNETYVLKPLPAFKHLVVSGVLSFGKGESARQLTNWNPHFDIGDNAQKNTVNAVKVLDRYADGAQIQVRNDTLYISFHHYGPYKTDPYIDYDYHSIELFKVMATNLQSVTVSSARFMITGAVQGPPAFKVNLNNSSMDMAGLSYDRVDLFADSNSRAAIYNKNITDLYYSIKNKSKLVLDASAVKHSHAIEVDGTSLINVEGKAEVLKGVLSK